LAVNYGFLRSRGEPQRIVVKIAKLPELFTLSATRTRSDVRFRGNSGHQRAAIQCLLLTDGVEKGLVIIGAA
jgi:hypothetical protein